MKPNNFHKLFIAVNTCSLLLVFATGCSSPDNTGKNKNSQTSKQEPQGNTYKKPASTFNDTIVITGRTVVFYEPDSLQREKIRAVSAANLFETEVHTCYYLKRNALAELKKFWPELSIVETSSNRYILFVKADNTATCIDLDEKGDMCGAFLFDGKKEPELADMMNIDTALGFYFSR